MAITQRRFRHAVADVLVSAVVLGSSATGAGPVLTDEDGPILTGVVIRGEPTGKLFLRGETFSPGDLVYVAIYDHIDAVIGEAVTAYSAAGVGRNGSLDPASEPGEGNAFGATYGQWLTADPTAVGPNGGVDPATGYAPGGTFESEIGIPCGVTLATRAYDRGTASWSNWASAFLDC